jgi:transcriptional regulator with XRE-family HTH domain
MVADLRDRRGIKLQDLADRIKVSVRTLRKVETVSKPIRNEDLANIATQLGTSMGELLPAHAEPEGSGSLADNMGLPLKLNPISSALELHNMAKRSYRMRYS